MWSWIGTAWKAVFGGSTSGKSIAETAVDVVKDYNPGVIDQHNMAVEDVKVGDESQAEARKFDPAATGTDVFNRIVDGLNRLPRPLFAGWAFCELAGILDTPASLMSMNPIVLNIIWTIIGFYFGVRTISQDLPKAISAFYEIKGTIAKNS